MRFKRHINGEWVLTTIKVPSNGSWVSVGDTNISGSSLTGTSRWIDPIDNVAAKLRPTIKPLVTLEVGTDKQYKTIKSAIEAGKTARGNTLGSPDSRIDILVYPGVYNENISLPHYSALVGMSNDKSDITILGISNGSGVGIVETTGSAFVENVTIIHPAENASWAPKYPVHGGHTGVNTWINCRIEGQAAKSGGGGTAFGADGGWSGWVIGYKSEIIGLPPTSATNSHGPNSGPGVMADYWIDCTFVGSISFNGMGSNPSELHLIGNTRVDGSIQVREAKTYIGPNVVISGVKPSDSIYEERHPVVIEGMNPVELKEYYGG